MRHREAWVATLGLGIYLSISVFCYSNIGKPVTSGVVWDHQHAPVIVMRSLFVENIVVRDSSYEIERDGLSCRSCYVLVRNSHGYKSDGSAPAQHNWTLFVGGWVRGAIVGGIGSLGGETNIPPGEKVSCFSG